MKKLIYAFTLPLILIGCGSGGSSVSNQGTPPPPGVNNPIAITVTDINTGLTWQKKDDGIKRNYIDSVSYCSSLAINSNTNWRLPTVHELTTLIDYSKANPATTIIDPPSANNNYWTITSSRTTGQAWNINLWLGYIYDDDKTLSNMALCVADTMPVISFVDNNNGTITQTTNNLMWQQNTSDTTYNWLQATGTYDYTSNPNTDNICGSLNLAGFNDWRLPTVSELITTIDYRFQLPATNTTLFPVPNSSPTYWAVDNCYYTGNAWYVRFMDGSVTHNLKTLNKNIRCVRDI